MRICHGVKNGRRRSELPKNTGLEPPQPPILRNRWSPRPGSRRHQEVQGGPQDACGEVSASTVRVQFQASLHHEPFLSGLRRALSGWRILLLRSGLCTHSRRYRHFKPRQENLDRQGQDARIRTRGHRTLRTFEYVHSGIALADAYYANGKVHPEHQGRSGVLVTRVRRTTTGFRPAAVRYANANADDRKSMALR